MQSLEQLQLRAESERFWCRRCFAWRCHFTLFKLASCVVGAGAMPDTSVLLSRPRGKHGSDALFHNARAGVTVDCNWKHTGNRYPPATHGWRGSVRCAVAYKHYPQRRCSRRGCWLTCAVAAATRPSRFLVGTSQQYLARAQAVSLRRVLCYMFRSA